MRRLEPGDPSLPILLGIDGFDGSGKTTLARGLLEGIAASGLRARLIDHTLDGSSRGVLAVTEALKVEEASVWKMSHASSVELRRLRLAERLKLARDSGCEVCVLDRFVWSDLGALDPACRESFGAAAAIELLPFPRIVVIHLEIPFEATYPRLQIRGDAASPREKSGKSANLAAFSRFVEVSAWSGFGLSGVAAHHSFDSSSHPTVLRDDVLRAIQGMLRSDSA